MKETGVVRRIDELGRLVIPKEIRKTLKLREGESIEIFIDGENIVLKRHSHISEIKSIIESLMNVLKKDIGLSYFIVEQNRIVDTSKDMKMYLNENTFELVEGEFLNLRINDEKDLKVNSIVKGIKMHGDTIAHIVFIKDDINQHSQTIEFVCRFLKDIIEKD